MSGIVVFILRLLLIGSLYAFVGWAIYTIWWELRVNNELTSARKIPAITLSMLEMGEEKSLVFTTPEVTLGRDTSCDFPIINETVSARHARLSFHHKQWWVEDLQSTNGTFLNDERVSLATVIISGDELRCGKINLIVTLAKV
jgi:pSer/pThr/pTyr-binding forkhead associated (FHA) protein